MFKYKVIFRGGLTMPDENQNSEPISDREFSQELDALTGEMRSQHFLQMLTEGEGLLPCPNCAETIFLSQAFCTYCGKQNPNYDEARFELENGETVAVVRAEDGCPDTHAALRRGLLCDKDLKPREGKMYCSECGALVDINQK